MSTTQAGPGWWQASDGRWYPPEALPGPPGADALGTGAIPYGSATGYPVDRGVDGLAIASLVLSITWFLGLGSLLAVILGAVSRRRIRDSGGALTGDGLALSGIIIGIVGLAGAVLFAALIFAVSVPTTQSLSIAGTSGSSASCIVDARVVDVAVATYSAEHPSVVQVTRAELTSASGTLTQWPTNGAYAISLAGDTAGGGPRVGVRLDDGVATSANDVVVTWQNGRRYDATADLNTACAQG